MTTGVLTPGLADLVLQVRGICERRLPDAETAVAVADALRPVLELSDLLTDAQREASSSAYCQHVLHVEPDASFSIVSLVWLPGQSTPVHDHVSWCTVGVYAGQESETRYRVAGTGGAGPLEEVEQRVNPTGSVCGIAPPGDIHRVTNSGATTAISLHVYGADIAKLGSSIRREYRLTS